MTKRKLLCGAAMAGVHPTEAKVAAQLRSMRHLRPEVDARVREGEMATEVVQPVVWALLDALMTNGSDVGIADAIGTVRSELDAIERQAANPDLTVAWSSIYGDGRRGA